MKKNSKEAISLKEKYEHYFPGGHSNKMFIPKSMQTMVSYGEGNRLLSTDGNEYIDYTCGLGPNILGHRHPEYIAALKQLMDSTTVFIGAQMGYTENDVIAAEKIIQHVPCAERIKFANSGTEAVQAAMRIARAHTGRPYILTFEEHYHGWVDTIFGLEPAQGQEGKPFAVAGNVFDGHAPGAEDGVLMIEWNNIEVLEETLKKCGHEIASIIMEPIAGNAYCRFPKPGYLEKVRELCDHYGIVLCFDEVLTGFRVGLNSAQGMLGVTPDLTTLAKAVSGGMPISAVVGKAEVMDTILTKKTVLGGTYIGHPLCVQGIITTLGILERDNGAVYKEMESVQQRFMSGVDEIARRRGISLRLQGVTGIVRMLFGVDPNKEQYLKSDSQGLDLELCSKFSQLLHDQGIKISIAGAWLFNIMHSDRDTDIALEAVDRVMSEL